MVFLLLISSLCGSLCGGFFGGLAAAAEPPLEMLSRHSMVANLAEYETRANKFFPLATQTSCERALGHFLPLLTIREGVNALASVNARPRPEQLGCLQELVRDWPKLLPPSAPMNYSHPDQQVPDLYFEGPCPAGYVKNQGLCMRPKDGAPPVKPGTAFNLETIQGFSQESCRPEEYPMEVGLGTPNGMNPTGIGPPAEAGAMTSHTFCLAKPPEGEARAAPPTPGAPATAFPLVARLRLTHPNSEVAPVELAVPLHVFEDAVGYLHRRLLSSYQAHLRQPGADPAVESFCQGYLAEQEQLKAYLRHHEIESRPQGGFRHTERFVFDRGLSEAQAASVFAYSEDYFTTINPALWSGKLGEAEQVYLKAATAALERLPPFRGQVYRFAELPTAVLEQHQVGQIVTYQAFTSTSADPTFQWPTSHRFVIHGGQRGRAIDLLSKSRGEEEVLFPPGTRFKVLSREPWNRGEGAPPGITFVLAEVDEAGNVIHPPASP